MYIILCSHIFHFGHSECDNIAKYKKYENDFTNELIGKYFSDKDILGGKNTKILYTMVFPLILLH